MTLRSSSVSLPHFSLAAPLNCFQLPSTRFQSIFTSLVTLDESKRTDTPNVPGGTVELKGSPRRLGFAPPCLQDEFSIAVRLLAPFEDQIASCLECDAVEAGSHRPVQRIAPVLAIHHERHPLERLHHHPLVYHALL